MITASEAGKLTVKKSFRFQGILENKKGRLRDLFQMT